ncbi:hypothetical protein B0H11DRAFT_2236180 [Mycena galericulata]|nr:hypothetical protein B0H11DRAFT_2236180 [Mycena galericulata]
MLASGCAKVDIETSPAGLADGLANMTFPGLRYLRMRWAWINLRPSVLGSFLDRLELQHIHVVSWNDLASLLETSPYLTHLRMEDVYCPSSGDDRRPCTLRSLVRLDIHIDDLSHVRLLAKLHLPKIIAMDCTFRDSSLATTLIPMCSSVLNSITELVLVCRSLPQHALLCSFLACTARLVTLDVSGCPTISREDAVAIIYSGPPRSSSLLLLIAANGFIQFDSVALADRYIR